MLNCMNAYRILCANIQMKSYYRKGYREYMSKIVLNIKLTGKQSSLYIKKDKVSYPKKLINQVSKKIKIK
jgi:hypothetical protein